jgi:hypothetical protein
MYCRWIYGDIDSYERPRSDHSNADKDAASADSDAHAFASNRNSDGDQDAGPADSDFQTADGDKNCNTGRCHEYADGYAH